VGPKRIRRLTKAAGISGKSPRRFRRTTDSNHAFPIADNRLDRKFAVKDVGAPDHVWAGDITYLATREGWLYLAIVLDLYSRKVIGWSLSSTMHRELVITAFRSAIRSRRPKTEVLFHCDRGSQYASSEFREVLDEHGFVISMSGKGECCDNAVVESFFGTMKSELDDPVWKSRAAAKAAIFEYIEVWYNLRRRHSTGLDPV
jgi:putative transposase